MHTESGYAWVYPEVPRIFTERIPDFMYTLCSGIAPKMGILMHSHETAHHTS